jgi:ribonuclease HII
MTDVINMYQYEEELIDDGINLIAGVDEAGRGPIAGPVVIASCILPVNYRIPGLNDSKQLSKKKREELYKEIVKHAVSYIIIFVSAKEVDESNIYSVTQEAMKEALLSLDIKPEYALIDFMPIKDIDIPTKSITHGDALSASIAAASILAKVSRDEYMAKMDIKYPNYGFKHNMGYATKMHMESLEKYGPCPIHRKTFYPVSKYFSETEQLSFDLFDEEN